MKRPAVLPSCGFMMTCLKVGAYRSRLKHYRMPNPSSRSEIDTLFASGTNLPKIEALLASCMPFSVEGINGKSVTAVIWPNEMSQRKVTATVEWHGTDMVAYFIKSEGDPCAWFQRFTLLYLAAGPQLVANVPVLAADKWHVANLILPDVDGADCDTAHLTLHKATWLATLVLTTNGGSRLMQQIPPSLQALSVGELFAEMTSQLLLGRPWLS
jgi:hypothetical protein